MGSVIRDVPDWLVAVAGVLIALGVIWRRVLHPLIATVSAIADSVHYVEHEMHFNGGKTARDAIQHISDDLARVQDRLAGIERLLQEAEVVDLSQLDEDSD